MAQFNIPVEFTRAGNTDHTGELKPIADDEKFAYGTAGFRFNASKLPFIVFRCSYVASLRARQLNSAIGLMITASHNPEEDNGVKLVDPNGDMLNTQWEKYATEIVNATDDDLPSAIRALESHISKIEKPYIMNGQIQNARVVCGMDTRKSGPHLMKAAKEGAAVFNVLFEDVGMVTTPMIHYITKSHNYPQFAQPTVEGYYDSICTAFIKLYELTDIPDTTHYQPRVMVDCANGVGAPCLKEIMKRIPEEMLEIVLRNDGYTLNHLCGADYVKIGQTLPADFFPEHCDPKCATFDGDADRLLYFRSQGLADPDKFWFEAKSQIQKRKAELFDGDKIACLYAYYIQEMLLDCYEEGSIDKDTKIDMRIVQTAYANGASTQYIKADLGFDPACAATGVKNLHREASKADIGIYFEANGHGTIVFSPFFDSIFRKKHNPEQHPAMQRLHLFSRVINETVGDAIADLLAVEICLRHFGWSMDKWADMYEDIPCMQIKVPVPQHVREAIKTTPDEQRVVEPKSLQDKIDREVNRAMLYGPCRAFVRPSGTENIVRIYVEANLAKNCADLGQTLKEVVEEFGENYKEPVEEEVVEEKEVTQKSS